MKPIAGALLAIAFLCLPAPAQIPERPDLLQPEDTIVLAGGTNFVQSQFEGYLETLLTIGHPYLDLKFRAMAWEADTVYRQQRPLNFPAWNEQLTAVESTVIIAQFGQMESLDGKEKLSGFEEAYHALLDTFATHARVVILVSPMPFEPFPFLSEAGLRERNENAKSYTDAVRRIAEDRGCFFVDVFTPRTRRLAAGNTPSLTANGVHLNEQGHLAIAKLIASQLGVTRRHGYDLEPLRHRIIKKNRLWFNYWRPTNWAFLHGDRTHVQSSRDHQDMEIRWFPAEMEQYLPKIREAEQLIHVTAFKLHEKTELQ